jgi:4-amino-4-deoxy-L-arabinose transferase-like glycosyltransferase
MGAVFICIAGFRAAYFFLPPAAGDGGMYLLIAKKLLSGEYFFSADPDTFTLLYRTPGYPLFLALLSFLPGAVERTAAAAQHLLGLLSAFLIYKIALLAWGRRSVAAAGALFVGLHFHFPYFESYLLSETLSVFLACAALYCALSLGGNKNAGPAAFALGGLVAACAALCRPELLVLLGACAVFLLAGAGVPAFGRPLKLAAYVLPAAMLLGAWTLRNGLLYDYWGLTPNSQITFFSGPAGRCLKAGEVEPDIVSSELLKYRFSDGLGNRAVTALTGRGIFYQWTATQAGALAARSVVSAPGAYFRASFRQLYDLLRPGLTWPPRDITETVPDLFSPVNAARQPAWFLRLAGAVDGFFESFFLVPLFLAGCGLAVFQRSSRAGLLLAAVPACLLLVYAFLSPVSIRYRVVAEPFMGLLAANAVFSALSRLSGGKEIFPVKGSGPGAPAWMSAKWAAPVLMAALCCWCWFLYGLAKAYRARALSSSPEAASLLNAALGGRLGKEALVRLGYLANERGLYPEALRYSDLALGLDRGNKMAADSRAEALFRMGRGREALAELNRTLAAYPGSADVLYNMAWINYLSDEKGKAAENFDRAIKLPGLPPALRANARLLRNKIAPGKAAAASAE